MPANPSKDNLLKAYKSHKKVAQAAYTLSHKLLYFYAAECGLKCYYLKRNNLPTAEQGNLKSTYGHKLTRLLRDCNIPNFTLNQPNDLNGAFPIREFHEYMRYGATITAVIETSQMQYIKAVVDELEKHL